jgi:hypothetical protein
LRFRWHAPDAEPNTYASGPSFARRSRMAASRPSGLNGMRRFSLALAIAPGIPIWNVSQFTRLFWISGISPRRQHGSSAPMMKEHAWKLILFARADARQIPPTHFRSTTSRNNDVLQRVHVSRGVCPGFRGVCDTVLTQTRFLFKRRHIDAHGLVHSICHYARA